MENKNIEKQIQEINEKLDFLTSVMRNYERRQRELQELKEDLTRIGKDVFQVATEELDEVAHHFDSSDILYLLKKLLRNTRNIIGVMDQLESAADFFKDAAPLTKDMFDELLETLAEFEKKGYFEFLKEAIKIFDTIVTSFSPEDVRELRENIASILLTVKNMTQPEMLGMMNNAVSFYRYLNVPIEGDISYWSLLKELRKPEMKRGIAFVIQFMKNMANPNNNGENTLIAQPSKKKED